MTAGDLLGFLRGFVLVCVEIFAAVTALIVLVVAVLGAGRGLVWDQFVVMSGGDLQRFRADRNLLSVLLNEILLANTAAVVRLHAVFRAGCIHLCYQLAVGVTQFRDLQCFFGGLFLICIKEFFALVALIPCFHAVGRAGRILLRHQLSIGMAGRNNQRFCAGRNQYALFLNEVLMALAAAVMRSHTVFRTGLFDLGNQFAIAVFNDPAIRKGLRAGLAAGTRHIICGLFSAFGGNKIFPLGCFLVKNMEMLTVQNSLKGRLSGFRFVFQRCHLKSVCVGGKGKEDVAVFIDEISNLAIIQHKDDIALIGRHIIACLTGYKNRSVAPMEPAVFSHIISLIINTVPGKLGEIHIGNPGGRGIGLQCKGGIIGGCTGCNSKCKPHLRIILICHKKLVFENIADIDSEIYSVQVYLRTHFLLAGIFIILLAGRNIGIVADDAVQSRIHLCRLNGEGSGNLATLDGNRIFTEDKRCAFNLNALRNRKAGSAGTDTGHTDVAGLNGHGRHGCCNIGNRGNGLGGMSKLFGSRLTAFVNAGGPVELLVIRRLHTVARCGITLPGFLRAAGAHSHLKLRALAGRGVLCFPFAEGMLVVSLQANPDTNA